MITTSAPRRAVAALLVVAALVLGLWPAASDAAYRQKQGWWWRFQTGLVSVPPPSTVPTGGFAIGQSVDGPTAVAAVAFEVGPDELDPVLVLEVAGDAGGPAASLVACPPLTAWSPAEAGEWELRPGPKCALHAAPGERGDDGSTWSFDLSSFPHAGVLDVTIVPADDSAPFELTFQPVDSDSLVTRPSAPTTVTAPPSVPDPPPPPPPPATFEVGTPTISTPPPAFTPVSPPSTTAFTPARPVPTTQLGTQVALEPVGRRADPRRLGIFVLVMAAALVAMGWGETVRPPVPLGPVASTRRTPGVTPGGTPRARGVGRFRRDRTGEPPRLH